jgi:hypothetical protein
MGGSMNILTAPVMLSTSASSVEVGGNVTITCMTSLALPLSYTITGVISSNLNSASLTGSFTQPSQSIIFNVVSGTGSTMTMTVSGGYPIAVNITKALTTTVYNPTETYRFYNTDAGYVVPPNSKMYSPTGAVLNAGTGIDTTIDANGKAEFFIYLDRLSTITGAYFQNRSAMDHFLNGAYLYYSADPLPSDKSLINNFKNLNYTRLDHTTGSLWSINGTSPYGTMEGVYTTNNITTLGCRTEITFLTPVNATVFKFTYVSANQYPGFRFALKYMGNGLITQLIAPTTNQTMTASSSMYTIASQLPYNATSTILDVSCNNTYYFMGFNNGSSAVGGISGEVNTIDNRRYIRVGNGCLRSYIRWVPNNTATPKLTIMCWVYLTGHKAFDTIAGFDEGTTEYNQLCFGMHNGYLKLTGNVNNLANAQSETNIFLSLNTWYHVCATWRPGTTNSVVTYYVNGSNRGTFTTENLNYAISSNGTFYVGKYSYTVYKKFDTDYAFHRINYLRLFSDELTASEILSYYDSEK